jgi:hypothetical protein
MAHQFSQVPQANIPRSTFDRSHGRKQTFDAGYLVPVLVDEALPGDTIKCNMNFLARLATPIYPLMDNMFLESFFFAVPYRLVWDNWHKFNGAQDNPGDSIDFTIPTLDAPAATGFTENSLADYFGLPIGIANLTVNSLHFRGANLIWNEWFRDQNLQDSVVVDTDNGPDNITDYVLLRRGKRHDYFTSCLPWPQKGDAVTLPLGTTAPVLGIGKQTQNWATGPQTVYETGESGSTSFANYQLVGESTADRTFHVEEDPNNSGFPGIYADLANAAGATINELRQSFQIQKLLERDARSGTRLTEIIRQHFGIVSPDQRLQRPEYLGGGSSPIIINPIAQQSESGTTPQGNLAAIGVGSGTNHGFSKSFTEHCLILGFVSVRADLTYQQGLDRMWSRQTRYDYYWPALSMIGEQEVLNKEIYCQNDANDDLTWGYQERYAEYRYKNSVICGSLRSTAATPLDSWHLSQHFTTLPVLGDTFIQDTPPVDRVIAVPSEPHFIFDSYFHYSHTRPMPLFGVPGLIDHF